MSEIRRRTKKKPPPAVTGTPPPRRERVTLTKDVSSRYRKLVPRPRAGGPAAGGPAASRPPRTQGPADRPEQGGPPKQNRKYGFGPGGGGSSETMKDLVRRELPEAARHLRETQDLLRSTAEEVLTILENWEGGASEEARAAQPLVTALFEKMSFQDLASQRLTKVENFLKALGEFTRPGRPRPFSKTDQAGAPESGTSRPRPARPFSKSKDKTLKGPQAAGGGLDQNEVEALLADLQGPTAPGPQGRGK